MTTLDEVVDSVGAEHVAAIGITNQRETVVAWDRTTGEPYGTAIVWQDRRTAARCDELEAQGHLGLVRSRTGLVLDPYFSGTKFEWLLTEGAVEVVGRPRPRHDRLLADLEPDRRRGVRHRSDERQPHDAVRHRRAALGPRAVRSAPRADVGACPRCVPSSGRFGVTSDRCAVVPGIPISGDRRRPAGGAVRPGVLRARHGEEHVRHRQLRAAQRRRPVPATDRGDADDGRLGARRRHGRLRPRRARSS